MDSGGCERLTVGIEEVRAVGAVGVNAHGEGGGGSYIFLFQI